VANANRSYSGEVDLRQTLFRAIAFTADALEDAGCTDAELLAHLRGPGPHVRGCSARNLVLSKE
jgi:hypothetical protein